MVISFSIALSSLLLFLGLLEKVFITSNLIACYTLQSLFQQIVYSLNDYERHVLHGESANYFLMNFLILMEKVLEKSYLTSLKCMYFI